MLQMGNNRLKQITFSFMILMLLSFQSLLAADDHDQDQSHKEMQVGVILDMDSWDGKFVFWCIKMAISDFYEVNPNYKTRIVLNTRDTKGEPLLALSAALDLLENTEVQSIIGPDSTVQSRLLEILEHKTNIPILTSSTSPFSTKNPYLFQIAQDETAQFKGIATMVESFKQSDIILICEDTSNGREMSTYIITELQEKNIHVAYTSLISTSSTDEQIHEELHKLQNMKNTMFIMHTSPSLSSNIISHAKEVGMMSEGYMWILTTKTTDFLNFKDYEAIESMQGVVGFKSYFPKSRKLDNLVSKWRKEYYNLNPFVEIKDVDCNGIWAYDAVYALAMVFENMQTTFTGTSVLNQISRTQFHGLGGEFKLKNGKTISKPIEVVNVIANGARRVGFWTGNGEFVKNITKTNSSLNNGLENIIFPGGIRTISNGRKLEMNGKKLRIIVPDFREFPNLLQMAVDPETNLPTVSGYCGDVFNAASNAFKYEVDIEFVPYLYEKGRSYNDIIDKVYFKEFDGAIGDITITLNRSHYVDFTLPISDLGIGTLARNAKKSMWIFLYPLSANLWFTSFCFFLLLGFVIWFIEHRTNKQFQGSNKQQIGMALWFAFSTLVYAHREKLQSNLSRFVVTIWVFVVLVLTSSYTATLSSLLTVHQMASTEGSIKFQGLSAVGGIILNNLQYSADQIYSPEEYVKSLRSGKVGTIIDEIPYIKSVLALYSGPEFSMVATSSITNGFAFVFQKGSPWTKKLSIEIAKLREDGTLKALEDKWLKRRSSPPPTALNLYMLRGLFLISGVSMAFALLVSMVYIAREKCHDKTQLDILTRVLKRSDLINYMRKIVKWNQLFNFLYG